MDTNNRLRKKTVEQTDKTESRVHVYIGPSVRGVIINGSIHIGTRKEVLEKLKTAIELHPKIARLIVPDREVSAAKEQLKEGNNGLSKAYNALSDEREVK